MNNLAYFLPEIFHTNYFFLLKTVGLLPTMFEFFLLCLLHFIKFAHPCSFNHCVGMIYYVNEAKTPRFWV